MQNKSLSFLEQGGSVLSDKDIKRALKGGHLDIKPSRALNIQPSSIDLHLARTVLVFARRRNKEAVIDLKKPVDQYVEYEVLDSKKGGILHPHEFILGVTTEWFRLPAQLLANVEGKSSLGRLGLVIHATAGFIDPGFSGHVTLEITNLTDQPLLIYPQMSIGQIRFSVLTSAAENCYGSAALKSKYVNDFSKDPRPMPSQYWKNFK